MTPKQQAIAAAWGENWESVKDQVNENGWMSMAVCSTQYVEEIQEEYPYVDEDSFEIIDRFPYDKDSIIDFRPRSLTGIEDNNGWLPVGDDHIPESIGLVYVMGKQGICSKYSYTGYADVYFFENFTHWQPIIKPKKPIY